MRRALILSIIVVFIVAIFTSCNKDGSIEGNKLKEESKVNVPTIYGKWTSQKGTLFEFSEDEKYGYYKDKNDTTDNYYKGTLKIMNGKEAMDELGISDEEYNRTYKKYVGSEDNIFALKMYMETLHSEGIDKSSILDKNNYYFFTFLISKDDLNKGIAINVSEPQEIEVTRSN